MKLWELQFKRDWQLEAWIYWKRWLRCRRLVKSLRMQNRQLKRVLYYRLKKD